MTGTSTASVKICGECFVALTVVERTAILVALLHRNGLVEPDGTIGPFFTAMFKVVDIEDAESASGKSTKRVGLAATLTKSLARFGFMRDGKLLATNELLALRYLPESGVTEVDFRALGFSEELLGELYHKKCRTHMSGPMFGGESVVVLGCDHATAAPATSQPARVSEREDMQAALDLEEAATPVVEEVQPAELAHEVPVVAEPTCETSEVATVEVSDTEVEADTDAEERLTAELLQAVKDGSLADLEMVEKLVELVEGLQEQIAGLEDELTVHRTRNERLNRSNAVLREQVGLLRERLAASQLPREIQERIVRALRGKGTTPESSES